ncbi:MAG: helix-turn-helix transcriptional regulator [Alphaproteobacteria bacterium]
MKNEIRKKIGLKVKALREKSKLSQESLAEQCNISWRTVSNIERGTCLAQIDTLVDICSVFNVGLDYLLDISLKDYKTQSHKELEALIFEKISSMKLETLKYTSAQIDLILRHWN